MNIDRLLVFAADAGKVMLQSGGEIYRVEETVSRICQSFGVDEVDVIASPTTVMISIIKNEKVHSIVKRISRRKVDLNKVHNINSLSRVIHNEHLPLETCEEKLKEICKDNPYPKHYIILFSGIATSTFTVLFGGNLNDLICAFIIGVFTKFIDINLRKSHLNEFFIDSICGTFIAISSVICLNLNLVGEIDKLIAGCIMLLVPGLSLTNSIRDILEGELISGLTRAAEALFIGISVAVGTGCVLHFYLKLGGM